MQQIVIKIENDFFITYKILNVIMPRQCPSCKGITPGGYFCIHCGRAFPETSQNLNLLKEVRDLLKDSQDDSDSTNFSVVAISLFSGLVALSALLITWVQVISTPGLSPEIQKALGGFGGFIIQLEAFFIGLILLCTLLPPFLKWIRKRQRRRISPH
jgi:hypothetical protein